MTLYPGRRPDRLIRYEVQQFCTQLYSPCAGLVHVVEHVYRNLRRRIPRACSKARAASALPFASSLYLFRRICTGQASVGANQAAHPIARPSLWTPLFLRQDAGVSHTLSSTGYMEVRKRATLPRLLGLSFRMQSGTQPIHRSSVEHRAWGMGRAAPEAGHGGVASGVFHAGLRAPWLVGVAQSRRVRATCVRGPMLGQYALAPAPIRAGGN
jgi:hypothetical protein